jgi:tetratricopeptide (TPR) repeat protein
MKLLSLLCLMVLLVFSHVVQVQAKQVEFTRNYTYEAGEADSKLSCRTIALEQVKRLLLEELGTYLVSNTIVKDSQLSKDEIVTYTAGSVATIVIEERWDGRTYFLKAKIKADEENVAKSIAAIRQDQEKTQELERLRKQANSSLQEIERLKKQLTVLEKTGGTVSQQQTQSTAIRKEYDKAVNELSAKEYLEQGIVYRDNHLYERALEAFNRANQLAPHWVRPYLGRGITLVRLNKKKEALDDFEHVLKMEPDNMTALSYHGVTLFSMGDKNIGADEMTRACVNAPKNSAAVANMGWAYLKLKQPEKALELLTKALDLQKVKSGRTLYLRALAYRQTGSLDKSREDMRRAAELYDPSALKELKQSALKQNK